MCLYLINVTNFISIFFLLNNKRQYSEFSLKRHPLEVDDCDVLTDVIILQNYSIYGTSVDNIIHLYDDYIETLNSV